MPRQLTSRVFHPQLMWIVIRLFSLKWPRYYLHITLSIETYYQWVQLLPTWIISHSLDIFTSCLWFFLNFTTFVSLVNFLSEILLRNSTFDIVFETFFDWFLFWQNYVCVLSPDFSVDIIYSHLKYVFLDEPTYKSLFLMILIWISVRFKSWSQR